MHTHLAKVIDHRLAALGLDRAELARKLDVTPVSVSRWLREEGDCPIPWKHFPSIAVFLQVPIEQVLAAAKKDWPQHVEEYRRFVADHKALTS